jgi:aryl-alcohol dehydrogenase-like predicted oxidoreductase
MTLRPFGTTGLTVTSIGLGLAALGRPAYITQGRAGDLGTDRSVEAMERRCHELLDTAYGRGVRYVDAARSYGLAEVFLASWLERRNLTHAAITIGSKWGYTYTGDWRMDAPLHESKDLSLDTLRRQIAETRSHLGANLDLYQIHSASLESGVLDDLSVIGELARLRSEGLRIGLTATGPRQADVIRRALEAEADGVNPFQSIQATWNLLEPSAGPAIVEAHRAGWGVIIKEALANGRLTERYGGPEIQPLRTRCAGLGTTVDALAIAAALAHPWTDVVLSGAVSPDQLNSNLHALDVVCPEDLPSVAEHAPAYWNRRGALAWN